MTSVSDAPSLDQQDWFRPDTFSVWLWWHEDGPPTFLVLYEWELLGLRGLNVVEAWGAVSEIVQSAEDRSTNFSELASDIGESAYLTSLGLVEMIKAGSLHRVGRMPGVKGFKGPPEHFARLSPRADSPS